MLNKIKKGSKIEIIVTALILAERQPSNPKKKYLTGNAYYAKRAGKEMKKRNIYYQGMGAKGGRPRIYNVV